MPGKLDTRSGGTTVPSKKKNAEGVQIRREIPANLEFYRRMAEQRQSKFVDLKAPVTQFRFRERPKIRSTC